MANNDMKIEAKPKKRQSIRQRKLNTDISNYVISGGAMGDSHGMTMDEAKLYLKK